MNKPMIVADSSVEYKVNEASVIVVALLWVFGLGSIVLAATILCGWRGASQVTFDWLRMRAVFYCR